MNQSGSNVEVATPKVYYDFWTSEAYQKMLQRVYISCNNFTLM
ncbi:hypothetical protein MAE02_62940 [Microvirga aerophila]|uniref:Uncharacterized protein n=1 Tax=Microvirga aerophila TaxID=670291 RepID=A0A512C307_9HYPH|nr:hypothetical protein MAE02_62940 [Microvirga aerophila]